MMDHIKHKPTIHELAAMAMQGLCIMPTSKDKASDWIAMVSYEIAEAMIEEGKKYEK